MGVEMPQYSEKKIRMYEAASRYLEALKNCTSKRELEKLRQEMVRLEAEYDDNPAYLALIRQKYTAKELDVNNQ